MDVGLNQTPSYGPERTRPLMPLADQKPSVQPRLRLTSPQTELSKRSRESRNPTPQGLRLQSGFDSLPDEIVQRIFWFVGVDKKGSDADPLNVGWEEEIEVKSEIKDIQRALSPLRLVSQRFLYLSSPLYFQRLCIGGSEESSKCRCESGSLVVQLTELLSTRPSFSTSRSGRDKRQSKLVGRNSCTANGAYQVAYGEHVRQLLFFNDDYSPTFAIRLLDGIHSLLPNLRKLSGMNLGKLPILMSPTINFPLLEEFTEIELEDHSPTIVQRSLTQTTSNTQLNPITNNVLLEPNNEDRLMSHEILFSYLNDHPMIKKISLRGFKLLDKISIYRFIKILESNLICIPVLKSNLSVQPNFFNFNGLTEFHFGLGSIIDLRFFQLIPTVTTELQRVSVDVGCKLIDQTPEFEPNWNLIKFLESCPRLKQFSFLSRKCLPERNRTTDWANLDRILDVAPGLESLNIRSDSITNYNFFKKLNQSKSSLSSSSSSNTPKSKLRTLNIWDQPKIMNDYQPQYLDEDHDYWSFVEFNDLIKLSEIGLHFFNNGFIWPIDSSIRRDLWLKFHSLCNHL